MWDIEEKERQKLIDEERQNEDRVFRTLKQLIKVNHLDSSEEESSYRQNMYEHRVMQLPISKIGELVKQEAKLQEVSLGNEARDRNRR